jgi:putative oxidoreductase
MEFLKKLDGFGFVIGRSILGIYFAGFGSAQIFFFIETLSLMRMKGVPFSSILLPVTILVQVLGGIFLILGRNLRFNAFLLCGLTIIINIYIHNFWTLSGDPAQGHEFQNFVKNLAICGGLLVLMSKDKS